MADPNKNIFDRREQDISELSKRLLNYVQDLFSEDDDTVQAFLKANSLVFTEPSEKYDWQALKPDAKKRKAVPPIPLTIMFNNAEAFEAYKLQLICGKYNAAKHNYGNGVFTTTLPDAIQYVPAERYYTSSLLKRWDEAYLSILDDGPASQESILSPLEFQAVKAELMVRLDFAQLLTNAEATANIEEDYMNKPCFTELVAPVGKNKKMPKLMITSLMTGSFLCFRPSPKDDGSLLLCHIDGGTMAKDLEERVAHYCTFGDRQVFMFENKGLWGPAEYGGGFYKAWEGNPPKGSPIVSGASIVVGVWSDQSQKWRLFAQVYDADMSLVGAMKIFGDDGVPALRNNWLRYLAR